MLCRFCLTGQAVKHSELCEVCNRVYSEETIELLYALTQPTKEGTARENI